MPSLISEKSRVWQYANVTRKFCCAALLLASTALIAKENAVTYSLTITGTATPPASVNPEPAPDSVIAYPLVRGNGINPSKMAHSFSSNNWNSTSPTLAKAVADNQYYEFTIATRVADVSFDSLDARLRLSKRIPGFQAQWQYSLDGFATAGTPLKAYATRDIAIGKDGGAAPTIDLKTVPALQNLPRGTRVTFRLYAWGAEQDSNSLAFGRSQQLQSDGGQRLGSLISVSISTP